MLDKRKQAQIGKVKALLAKNVLPCCVSGIVAVLLMIPTTGLTEELMPDSNTAISLGTITVVKNKKSGPLIFTMNEKTVEADQLTTELKKRASLLRAVAGIMETTRQEHLSSVASGSTAGVVAKGVSPTNQRSVIFVLKNDVNERDLILLNQIAQKAGIEKVIIEKAHK